MASEHQHPLDAYVAEIDSLGGAGDPRAIPALKLFAYEPKTIVDETLDPFSEAYFQQQVALYEELTGRTLHQETGELYHFDVGHHVAGSNPYHLPDIRFISKHARTILTCMALANLPSNAKILDAGSGWGLSSEMMAFCGATVTALDINPDFVELVRQRALRLGLPITSVYSPFDTFQTDERYDLLFFYECLHHSLKPWETLAHLGQFLKPGGKIVLGAEPGSSYGWKHWGLRIECLAAYCMRKFGWWEAGWTQEFLIQCFAKAGFELTIFPYLGLDNNFVGVAVRSGEKDIAPIDTTINHPIEIAKKHYDIIHQELVLTQLRYAALQQQVATAEHELATLKAQLDHVQRSMSVRLTAPFRYVGKGMRKLVRMVVPPKDEDRRAA